MATLVLTVSILAGLFCIVVCDCNQKYEMMTKDVSYITSPDYYTTPSDSGDALTEYSDCYYEITTTAGDKGTIIVLDVIDVALNCGDETSQLLVYDGFSRQPRYIGQVCAGGPVIFESPKYSLYLIFKTQVAYQSTVFRLRVRAEPKYAHCYKADTKVLDTSSIPGIITTPFYPYETDANTDCHWLIRAPEGRSVNVSIIATDMKGSSGCSNFGLFVYDGKMPYDDALMAAVCDDSLSTFQSSGSFLLVVFQSGPLVYLSGGGLKLQYSSAPLPYSPPGFIDQTLFFAIVALLLLLIGAIIFGTIFKLIIIPRRRKQAQRQQIAVAGQPRTARIISATDSQSELLPAAEDPPPQYSHVYGVPSSVTGSESSRQRRKKFSLKRLWNKSRRRRPSERRQSAPACVYRNNRGRGLAAEDFYSYHSAITGDLSTGSYCHHELRLPTYEEAVAETSESATVHFVLSAADLEDQHIFPGLYPSDTVSMPTSVAEPVNTHPLSHSTPLDYQHIQSSALIPLASDRRPQDGLRSPRRTNLEFPVFAEEISFV